MMIVKTRNSPIFGSDLFPKWMIFWIILVIFTVVVFIATFSYFIYILLLYCLTIYINISFLFGKQLYIQMSICTQFGIHLSSILYPLVLHANIWHMPLHKTEEKKLFSLQYQNQKTSRRKYRAVCTLSVFSLYFKTSHLQPPV